MCTCVCSSSHHVGILLSEQWLPRRDTWLMQLTPEAVSVLCVCACVRVRCLIMCK